MRNRLILLLSLIYTGWASAQPVFNRLMIYEDYQTTFHYIFPIDDYYLAIGLKPDMYLNQNGTGDTRIFCVKFSQTGELLEEKIIDTEIEHRIGIEVTGNNATRINDKIYFAFNVEDVWNIFTFHYYLYCIDLQGNLMFKQYSDMEGESQLIYGLNKTNDNQLILIGRINYDDEDRSMKMIKMDTLGNVLWNRDIKYQNQYIITGFCVAQMLNGDFIISGDTYVGNPPDGDWQMYYARTDSIGNVLWEHDLGVEGVWDNPAWFELREDGGMNLFGGYNQEPYFAKADGNGTVYFEQFYSLEGISASRFPIRFEDKYIFTIAEVYGGARNHVWVMDTNFNKILEHQIEFVDFTANQVQDVKLTDDCALIMCGYSYTSLGQKALIVKTNLLGESCGEPDCYDEYINEYGDCMSTSIETGMVAVESGVMISPNPMSDQFIITLKDQEISPKAIKIFTADGRQVMEMDYREEVLVSSLSAGLYLVEIVGEGFSYFAKVVVSKYE